MSLRKWRALTPEQQAAAKEGRPADLSRQTWRWLIMHGADKIAEIKEALAAR